MSGDLPDRFPRGGEYYLSEKRRRIEEKEREDRKGKKGGREHIPRSIFLGYLHHLCEQSLVQLCGLQAKRQELRVLYFESILCSLVSRIFQGI